MNFKISQRVGEGGGGVMKQMTTSKGDSHLLVELGADWTNSIGNGKGRCKRSANGGGICGSCNWGSITKSTQRGSCDWGSISGSSQWGSICTGSVSIDSSGIGVES